MKTYKLVLTVLATAVAACAQNPIFFGQNQLSDTQTFSVGSLTQENTASCGAATDPGCNGVFVGRNTKSSNTGAETPTPDPAPGNMSAMPVSGYLYSGATTQIWFEHQPWFYNVSPFGGHINISFNNSSSAGAHEQLSQMIRVGTNGSVPPAVIVNYYGKSTGQAYLKSVTDALFNDAYARCGSSSCPIQFSLLIDKGNITSGSAIAPGCPADGGGVSLTTRNNCIIAVLEEELDNAETQYCNVARPVFVKSGGSCLVGLFVIKSNFTNPAPNFTTIYTTLHAHTDAYAVPFKYVDQNSGSFTETGMDGAYAWPQPSGWSASCQFKWDAGGDCSTFDYLADFYTQARAHSSKIAVGGFWKGFDDNNASWGTNRVIAQQCGQLIGLQAAKVSAAGYSASSQLPFWQAATWNDYEEGTEVETGIDNCYTLTSSVAGTTLSWTLTPSDSTYASTSTIDHFAVYVGLNASALTLLADNISPASTSLSGLNTLLPAPPLGQSWQLYVYAVGKPLILNRLSTASSFSGGASAGIFVATDGLDTNPCTLASPCATPQHATSVVKSGPSSAWNVYLRGGTYQLSSTWTLGAGDSGTSDTSRVHYQNYPGETVWISGGKKLGAWTVCTTTLCPGIPTLNCSGSCTAYKIDLPTASGYVPFESLYYLGDTALGERRFRPRSSWTSYFAQQAASCVTSKSTGCNAQGACAAGLYECHDRVVRDAGDTLAPPYHGVNLHDPEMYVFEKWTTSRMKDSDPSGDGNPCQAGQTCFTGVMNYSAGADQIYGPSLSHRYLHENRREDFTKAKSFYAEHCKLDNCLSGSADAVTTLYYLAAPGEVPSNNFVLPQLAQLIKATSLQYVTFSGLNFGFTNYLLPAAGMPGKEHEASIPASLSFTNSSDVIFDTFLIAHTQDYGIELIGTALAGHGNTLQNGAIADTGMNWIRIGTTPLTETDATAAQFNLVQNVRLIGAQRVFPSGIGPYMQNNAHSNKMLHVEASDTYSGFIGNGACLNNLPSLTCTQGGTNFNYDNEFGYWLAYDIGQGVTSDQGCTHVANGSVASGVGKGTGNSYHDFICKDVNSNSDIVGYGGNCLYNDGGSAGNHYYNGLCLRVSSQSYQQNVAQNNLMENLIFAHFGGNRSLKKGAVGRGQDGPGAPPNPDVFTKSIVYYGLGNADGGPQSHANISVWGCYGLPCSSVFAFDYIDWYNFDPAHPLTSNPSAFFTTPTNSGGSTSTPYSFNPGGAAGTSTWQTVVGEDLHSISKNPCFVNPSYNFGAGDDYHFTPAAIADPTAAYKQVNFSPFDLSAPGLSDPSLLPPYPATVPAAFPLMLIDKQTGWGPQPTLGPPC